MPPKSEHTTQQPGADRFWGQFSQSKAGRSNEGEGAEAGARNGREPEAGQDGHCLEWCPICRSAELFKATVSPELKQQAESIQHEALGVFKAFLDAYAEKTTGGQHGASPSQPEDEPASPPATRVTDIPLD